ncbi:HAL/PAL/TAL family ammonia-lyase [Fretibacterium sp. OH1220_COT-178]|uniref:HAL/PAL/TAL family ammonia-lyase n=1 Tax=Fretibacterium sp. OH1220_COT-178 TaxID=2491047 RepID=UPI000F5F717F|nr:aromatic amino acid ammonia-lyase [Fretibacterium sp. OH1220_COT-178]RRD65425.1 aromatic amino acid lyase [Fretibacterium sp. OH1220_COT-178]
MDCVVLDGKSLSITDLANIANHGALVGIDSKAMERVKASRELVHKLCDSEKPIYGFNAGVGWNKDVRIERDFYRQFNTDMIRSHCIAIPPEASEQEVRATMAVRLNALLWGCTGSSPDIPVLMAAMLNEGIHPVIPERGSLGEADIGSLAHLGLAMIGEGNVHYRGKRMSAAEALREANLEPISTGPKDGHAIISSNALAAGQGALVLHALQELIETAEIVYAVSLEAFNGNTTPLDPKVQSVRPFKGQNESAAKIRSYLKGSYIYDEDPDRPLQDPLCFRDAAHVHGAVREAIDYVRSLLTVQINSSDDNPCLLLEEGRIVSCANFEPLPWVLGFEMLGIALSHVSKASCLRSIKLCTPAFSGLPRFLSPHPRTICFGTLQKTFVSLDNEIRNLINPSSMDGFCVAGEIEDRFTNAPFVVQKIRKVLDNLRYILGMELMHAVQALDFRGDKRISEAAKACHAEVRRSIAFYVTDRPLTDDIEKARRLIASGALLKAVADVR